MGQKMEDDSWYDTKMKLEMRMKNQRQKHIDLS